MTQITRVGYCLACDKVNRPKTNQHYIVFGAKSLSYQGKSAQRNGVRGFTPHIYEFNRLIEQTVYYDKICCMCGCGAYLTVLGDKIYIYLNDERYEECYTSLSNWNSLCQFKDTGFKI